MRLKSDEQRFLFELAVNGKIKDDLAKARASLSKFASLGYIDANGKMTKRGMHVASKITAPTQPESEKIPDGSIHGYSEPSVGVAIDSPADQEDFGTSLGAIDQPGIGPATEAEERSDAFGVGGLSDLPEQDRVSRHRSRKVR